MASDPATARVYDSDEVTIYHGDCLDVLPTLDPVDAVVTDPPYGLGFMGKAWDHGVPGVAFWEAVLSAMKPGAYLLAFGGTRTHHRLMVAIEDAGLELRDVIMWVYGSGFPKSLDVSKAIEKRRVEDVEPVRVVCRYLRAAMDSAGMTSRDLVSVFECSPQMIDHWAARDTHPQSRLPTPEQWTSLRGVAQLRLGGDLDAEVERLNARKGTPGDVWGHREVVGRSTNQVGVGWVNKGLAGYKSEFDISEPATNVGEKWDGWGTALKPSWEPIIVARKPLEGTVAANVLAHGVGGLNIDASRIKTAQNDDARRTRHNNAGTGDIEQWRTGKNKSSTGGDDGRWPANLIHDGSDEVTERFPDLGKASVGGGASWSNGETSHAGWRREAHRGYAATPDVGFGDSGSAARFFYCAKADKADRGEGNTHPTVKPNSLMRYLVKLVTPPGGTVLDPFMGSGSTIVAARDIGQAQAIGVEIDEHWCGVAAKRLSQPVFKLG